MYLPLAFQENMKKLLADEWQAFEESLKASPYHGLRINTLKISVEEFLAKSPFKLEKIPWTRDGFYIEREERPGKHAYYTAGLYYIQEPSAMLPAEVLSVNPGDRVLDICAAPGGKSAQLSAQLKGKGILVSNDISAERTKPLARNLALLGVTNALILNENPRNLARNFGQWFDAILVDAPCSGEGMFRRDENAPRSWEEYGPSCCMPLQEDILEHAARMLKPGGKLVYSTCTFSPGENEGMLVNFLNKHPEFEVLPINKVAGLADARPEWAEDRQEVKFALRAWPHKAKGEGHFVALLRKKADQPKEKEKSLWKLKIPKEVELWQEFSSKTLKKSIAGKLTVFAEHLYLVYEELPDMTGLKIVRPGLYLGEFKKNRFEPAHALALTLRAQDVELSVELGPDDAQLDKYLKGETISADVTNGWVLVTVDSFGVGWAKAVNGVLKNHYPKGWRKQ